MSQMFLKLFHFKMVYGCSQGVAKVVILHPVSSNDNILHNHSKIIKTRKMTLVRCY